MKFLRKLEDGFVLIMSLIILPIFLGFGLILIDIGRGNNAQADLQTIVDALALTGARELDGSSTAIDDAEDAMEQLRNPVSMLNKTGGAQGITYTTGDTRFEVVYLRDIPTNDFTAIDAAWKTAEGTTTDEDANYIYVRAYDRNQFSLRLIFSGLSLFSNSGNPPNTFPVGAVAVAKASSAICDMPPLFMCNPFEYNDAGAYDPDLVQDEFEAGNLHGRLIRLHPGGSNTAFPGNFSFLQLGGNPGASNLVDYFRGGRVPVCTDTETVSTDTSPGAKTSVLDGFNLRFDVIPNGLNLEDDPTDPDFYNPQIAENVRKGHKARANGPNIDDCRFTGQGNWGDDHIFNPDPNVATLDASTGIWSWNSNGTGTNGDDDGVYGFPDNEQMEPPSVKSSLSGTSGAYVGTDSSWNLDRYLDVNYNGLTPATAAANGLVSSFPAHQPSRYDVYRWEIANPSYLADRSPGPNGNDGEGGEPVCWGNNDPESITAVDPVADPRVVPVAIIDCGELLQGAASTGGQMVDVPVNTYASVFLARPAVSYFPSYDPTIDVEVIDIMGYGGNGTLETFEREEAILVR